MHILKTALSAVGLLAFAGTASAHATLEQSEARIGASAKVTLRVPHGCAGEATHTVRLLIPDGFYGVKPMPKAGWTLATVVGPYASPYDNHGTVMTEGVREVVWSGGHLEDAWYDEFVVRGTFGANLSPGTAWFPAMQLCANGVADWTDTSGVRGVPNPAPKLTLVAAPAAHGHGAADAGHGDHGAMPGAITLGNLTLTGPFARATLPNAPVAGGFLTIANRGHQDDRLVAAASPAAGYMEVHEMAMEGDVMRMRELAGGLPIPAGATVELKPGGFHVMFMDLKQPLVEGATVEVTLTFEKAGSVTVPLAIRARNAEAAGGHDHGAHGAAMTK